MEALATAVQEGAKLVRMYEPEARAAGKMTVEIAANGAVGVLGVQLGLIALLPPEMNVVSLVAAPAIYLMGYQKLRGTEYFLLAGGIVANYRTIWRHVKSYMPQNKQE